MFKRDHQGEALATRIDHLMTAVFMADTHDRLEALARHVAPDVIYVSPEAIAPYRGETWWETGLRRTSPVELNHGYFRFTWERKERGTVTMAGWAFGSVDETGAICRIVTFEGLVPAGPDGRS